MAGPAARLPSKSDRLRRNQQQIKDIYGLNRNRLSPQTIQNPSFGSAGAGGDSASAAQSSTLKTQGDTMIGPIAFFPVDVFIDSTTTPTNPSINIGSGAANPPDFSTYVLVTGSGTDDALNTIFGAAFAGQMLKMQAVVDIELFDGALAGVGNIVLNGLESTIVPAGSITEFLFDITTSPNGNQGGWRLASTGNAGLEDALLIARLSADQVTAGVVAWDLNFPLGDDTRIVVTATDGVYELVDGLFQLEGTLGLQMIEAGAGSVASAAWQFSSTEGGVYSAITNNSTVISTFATGRPEFTTQPHASVIADASGTSLFVRLFLTVSQGSLTGGGILNLASFASIDFLNEAAAGGGGGGASSLGELSDVTLTSPATDQVLTFNGAEWVNQSPSSGGMATDLSNMVSPTVPTVDLGMNGQSITGILNADFDGFGGINGLSSLAFFQANQTITSLGTGLAYQVASLQTHLFAEGGATIGTFDTGGLLMGSGKNITEVADISFALTGENQILSRFSQAWDANKGTSGVGIFNVPTSGGFYFEENGTSRIRFEQFAGIGLDIQDPMAIVFGDATVFPSRTGEISRNGNDIYAFTSNGVVNLADIGAGGAGNSISEGDSNVTVTDTGTGAVTITVDGTSLSSFTTGVGMVLEVPLSMVANNIVGTGNVTPNGNGVQDLGSNTTFWQEVYSSQYNVGLNSNVISGDSFGIDYTVSGSAAHNFVIGASQKMLINSSEIDFLDDVNLNGNDLRMNNGDVTLVDFMSFNGSGSLMNGIDFMTFHDSGGFLNLSGSDIINAGTIQASGKVTTGEIEINGNFNHDGSNIGFFGTTPISKRTVNLQGTQLFQVVATLSDLLDTLRDYGMINTNV